MKTVATIIRENAYRFSETANITQGFDKWDHKEIVKCILTNDWAVSYHCDIKLNMLEGFGGVRCVNKINQHDDYFLVLKNKQVEEIRRDLRKAKIQNL